MRGKCSNKETPPSLPAHPREDIFAKKAKYITTGIKPGDRVFHKPSGETWIVAYIDPTRAILLWCGWPPGWVKLSDCELIESASEEARYDRINKFVLIRRSAIPQEWSRT